jgi:hypothetical protein
VSRSPLVLAWLFVLVLVGGSACGWSEEAARSPVILYEDAAALVEPSPAVRGVATWYAARCPVGVVYLDRTDTCWPYVAKKDGGKGGEQKFYGAIGSWKYKDEPFQLDVVFLGTGRVVRIWVRDYCQACAEGRVLIDLSPLTILAGGLTLGQGRYKVELREVPAEERGK